ncbi:LPS-assembly protein LptD [Holospora elegans E1]|uniref:LPS-assembly protein LptD n=1 Tax=Holospora elegans E1 TaxID=1427503 RepID=A0A023DXL5_9PROT|nr:LPS-assembly protein LptD [Holospora elegans E1]
MFFINIWILYPACWAYFFRVTKVTLLGIPVVGGMLSYSNTAFALFSLHPSVRYCPHVQDWKAYQDSPFLVELQEGSYDEKSRVLIVSGPCTLRQGHVKLECSYLLYDQSKNEIFVQNGQLKDSAGDRIFFDKGTLKSTLSTGTLHNVRMLTYLRERITARKIIKFSEEKIRAERISYTPCHACKDRLSEEPLWSLHSTIVEQDQKNSQTEYTDTTLKLKGIPFIQVPYFYLPTRPRSGMLAPYVGGNVGAGFYTGLPYYYRMSAQQDLKVTPFYMQSGGGMIASDYRKRFYQGAVQISGAANLAPKQQTVDHQGFRGYGALDLDSHFSPHWRFFMHEYIVSDRTFFTTRPFFGFTSAPYLESKSGFEGFYPKHWFSFRTLRYQDLSPDDTTEGSCAVTPELKYCYRSGMFSKKITADIEVGTVSLYNKEGTQMQRATMDSALEVHHLTNRGIQIHGSVRLGQALYSAQICPLSVLHQPSPYTSFAMLYIQPEKVSPLLGLPRINTHYYRIFPEAEVTFRYPVMMGCRWIITPELQTVAAPGKINSWRIPNQDSQNVQFHDSNLLAHNRFTGLDRVDDGSRVNYALNVQYQLNCTQNIEAYIGQRWSVTPPALELIPVGIRKGFSDVVGRVSWNSSWAKLLYRFRVHTPKLDSQTHMLGGSIGSKILECSGNYIFISAPPLAINPLYRTLAHQITIQAKTNLFTRNWHLRAFVTQNLKKNRTYELSENIPHSNRPLNQGVGVGYENECFLFDFFLQYSRYRMAEDLRPGISFGISINLKQLGKIQTSKQLFSRKPDKRQSEIPSFPSNCGVETFFPT